MGYLITNPAGSHRQAAQVGMLQHVNRGHGIRDTLRNQVTRPNEAEQVVVNTLRTHRQADVYCWCQTEIVRGTFDRIARGLTESCGAPNCKEPE
jgi:hypothetical protein